MHLVVEDVPKYTLLDLSETVGGMVQGATARQGRSRVGIAEGRSKGGGGECLLSARIVALSKHVVSACCNAECNETTVRRYGPGVIKGRSRKVNGASISACLGGTSKEFK